MNTEFEEMVEVDVEKSNDFFASWFKQNPDKVLGEIKQIKTKYGEDAYTVIGDKEKLLSIDVPDYMQVSSIDPLISNEKEVLNETNSTPEDVSLINESIKKSKNRNKVIDKTKKEISNSESTTSTNLWSYEEVDETYNGVKYDSDNNIISEAITFEEKQAYALYLHRLTGKYLEGGFAKYDMQDNMSNIKGLMKLGVLCFDNTEKEDRRKYKPTFYYASGNVQEKNKKLIEDKDFYIQNFGEEIYNNHLNALVDSLEKVRQKRLTLTNTDKSKRIIVNIHSEFSKEFYVKPTIPLDEKDLENQWNTWIRRDSETQEIEWKVKQTISGAYKPYERNGGRNDSFGTYKLNLIDAFSFWLKGISNKRLTDYGIVLGAYVQNVDEIQKYYVEKSKTVIDKKEYVEYFGLDRVIKDAWWEKLQGMRTKGAELFMLFLEKHLQSDDRIRLELLWNQKFNSIISYDYDKVPILFRFAKTIGNELLDIRPEKKRAIAFNMLTGSTLLAYGVGLGKTFCSIFTIGQNMDLGLCKRPLIIVPNSVYPQFVQEIKAILPQYKVNGLFNLRGVYEEYAKEITDNSITIVAYSGLEQLGFKSEEVGLKIFKRVQEIVEQGEVEKQKEKEIAKQNQAILEFLGIAQSNSSVFFDEVGFDYLCVDEAHNYKNLISSVKGKVTDGKREQTDYKISGSRSTRAVKLFAIAQYVQINNINGNCLLLTATPFTNTPLEIYSMLSLIRYDTLKINGFGSIQTFFDFYADVKYEPSLNTKLEPIIKQTVKGFKNVISLQGLIFSMIDKPTKEEEENSVERPNKIVLPLWDKRINDNTISVSESNQVTTLLRMTENQKALWGKLYQYGNGKINYATLSDTEDWNITKCGSIDSMLKKQKKDAENDESKADYDSNGIRSVFCLTYGRAISLNPYLYRFSGYKEEPTPAEYIQASPKIEYAIECIRSVKKHHEKTNTPMSGQIIYMDKGVSCFDLILQYLIEDLGFSSHEVGIIAGSGDSRIGDKKSEKEEVQDGFLGRKLDFSDPRNPKYVEIPHEKRIKVIVGSGAIKEGVNLQFYATCLYNCEIDWNPTDMTQLEGRIWRQKNAFANVRIVVPLLENSLDAFMYGKLKEKTGRINQIWERDGKNEFDLDELDPEEMQKQTTRDVSFIAESNKRKKIKEFDFDLSVLYGEYNAFRNVRLITANIYEVYNKIASDFSNNPMQIVWNYLNFFRPSLITKPLINNIDLVLKPTEEERSMELRINRSSLNYTFEELDELLKKFREDKIIEYPRGYSREWKGLFEKVYPKFEVGERVKFKTRRGENEGIIDSIASDSYDNKRIVYDIDVNGVIIESINIENNEIESLDNPIEERVSIDLGGKELKLGLKDSANDLLDVYKFTLNKMQKGLLVKDLTSIEYIGYSNSNIPILGTFYSWYSSSDVISDYESLKSFPKFSDFYYQNFLKKFGYDLAWSRWIIDYKDYWNKNLIPKGILNEEMLTEKLTFYREKIQKIEEDKKNINTEEANAVFIEEAKEELRIREESGDKPLSPLECSRVFATPNPDYLGNNLLDFFTEKYIKSQKAKENIEDIELVEVKEPIIEVKEPTIFDKKLKLLKLMLLSAKGSDKDLIEKKIRLLNLMNK